jgi:secreted trypsin-like serine protease
MMKLKLITIATAVVLLLSLTNQSASGVTFPDNPKVSLADAPFLLNLWSYDPDTLERESSFCSGTIIEKKYFITAAHCVLAKTQFIVVADQESQSSRGVPISILKWVVHPRYSSKSLQNDIAVGLLNFETNNPKNTIALPSKTNVISIKKYRTLSGLRLYGWGTDQNERETQNPMSVSQIDYSLIGNKYHKNFNLNTMIAGGKYNKVEKTFAGACYGDSGGPLVQNTPRGRKELIGITSYGSSKGCDTGSPTVYTRVSYYLDFIKSTFLELNKEYEKDPGFLYSVDDFSKPLNSDEVFPVKVTERSNYSYVPVQDGGGVPASADINQIMLQSFKLMNEDGTAIVEDAYAYNLFFMFNKPYDFCVEKQKGSWLVQISLDSRQRVDLQLEVSPSSGCFEADKPYYNLVKKIKVPPSPTVCTSPALSADSNATEPTTFIFSLSKGCFGNSNKIWVRVLHTVDGVGDLEPGYDMWAGPFSTALPK